MYSSIKEVDVNILSTLDIENSQRTFEAFDPDNAGSIDKDDLINALEMMGISAKREEIIKLMNEFEGANNNVIEYDDFLKVLAFYRMIDDNKDENDFVDAFVAMGGNSDMSGHIDAQKLIQVIKEEFNMTIDIVKLIEDVDEDGSGKIEYGEFKTLLSNSKPDGRGE